MHSFFYFNDDIPTDDEFEKVIGDYLSCEFTMVMRNRKHLFDEHTSELKYCRISNLDEVRWKPFKIGNIFKTVKRGSKTYIPTGALLDDYTDGVISRGFV